MANTTTNVSGNRLTGFPPTLKIPPNYPTEPQSGKLEQLLLHNEYEIYHKFKPYTENTNLLKFGKEQPYIYTYIDEKDDPILPPVPRGVKFFQNRAFPLEASTTDLVRTSIYLTSGRGVEFLTKQFLLQAQATFDETGVYNPLEVPLAVASNISLGLIPKPQRHVNISGGVLGALASLIGISISNGNTAPASSVGQDALPTFGSTDGKGLLRAGTANKAVSLLTTKWPDAGVPAAGVRRFFNKLLKSAAALALNTIKAYFKPLFPLRQKAKYRGDEGMYYRMQVDASRRLKSYDSVGAPVEITDLRRKNVKALSNNRVYSALTLNTALSQYNNEQPYTSFLGDSNVSLVDTSLNVGGIANRNFRMARARAGDGINQVGVLTKDGSNNRKIPISPGSRNYPEWTEWNPYTDDVIAFFFYDIVNEKYIPFRATVKGINDSTTAQWDELRFIGRADQIYTYNGFVRSLAFQFTVVITSLADLLPTWQKINYMKTSLKPAGYTTKGIESFSRFMIPPMFTVTIGDMYKHQPIVITNFTVNIPESANWETLNEDNIDTGWEYLNKTIRSGPSTGFAQLPKEIEISVACNLLEKERAVIGGVDFGHAPRGDDGQFLEADQAKPYLPERTKFSEGILVRNSDAIANQQKNAPSQGNLLSAATTTAAKNIETPTPKKFELLSQPAPLQIDVPFEPGRTNNVAPPFNPRR